MSGTITLSASARFGFGGKQFVARVTGRHPKFTFAYEFMGRKEGKRGESTSVEVDDPGLYVTRDVDSKGRADDSFALVYVRADGELAKHWIDKADAMALAKRIDSRDSIDWTAEGTAYEPKPAPTVEAPTLAPDIAGALASALQAVTDERETHALALDNLAAVTREAAKQHQAGDVAGSHVSIARALDLAHELLGECDALEPLAAVLGHEDPDPMAAPTKGRCAVNARDLVVLETMPEQLRDSHRAARNWGRYPSNGAVREVCGRAVAEEIVAEDSDGYASIVCDADAEHVESYGYHWSVSTPGGEE